MWALVVPPVLQKTHEAKFCWTQSQVNFFLCRSVFYCIAACCSMLQCGGMLFTRTANCWWSNILRHQSQVGMLCAAACCSVLQRVAVLCSAGTHCVTLAANCWWSSILRDTISSTNAMCCSVVQHVAVCCSVLQFVAVCYYVLQCMHTLRYACCWSSSISRDSISGMNARCPSVFQCVAACCSVLQCRHTLCYLRNAIWGGFG